MYVRSGVRISSQVKCDTGGRGEGGKRQTSEYLPTDVEMTRNRDPSQSSGSSEVLLSEIPGGCGRKLRYSDSDPLVQDQDAEIWCGMSAKGIEGYYFVCRDCS